MQTTPEQKEAQTHFILLLVILLAVAIGGMSMPYFGIFLAALLAYILSLPLYRKLERKTPHRSPTFHASIAVFVAFVFLLIPVLLIVWAGVYQARDIGPALKEWTETLEGLKDGKLSSQLGWMRPMRARIAEALGMTSWDVQNWMIQNIRPWVERLDSFVLAIAQNAFRFLAAVFFFLLLLFFLFLDGPIYYRRLKEMLPLEDAYQEKLFTQMDLSVHGILRGWFLSALLQGGTAMIGFTLVDLPGAVLLGIFTAIVSVIPFLGAALVWVPAVLILFIQGSDGKGLFLLAWGAGVVSLVDNLAAPLIMGQRMHLPLPVLLFSILGGVHLFGFKGLILGPLIVSLAPTILEIYRRNGKHQHR